MSESGTRTFILATICVIVMSILTVSVQVRHLGLDYIITGTQQKRHLAVMEGNAGNPWQYRVLSEHVVDTVVRAAWKFGIPRPVATAFIGCRVIQNMLIFILCLLFYRALGIGRLLSLLGMSLLAWSMTHSLYDSDLQYNTYSDVIFYLSAGIVLVRGKYAWIIPITFLAALNRETSGLIPFLLPAVMLARCDGKSTRSGPGIIITVTSLIIYITIFTWLRMHYGEQRFLAGLGHKPGMDMFLYNVGRWISWEKLFLMFGIVPFIALVRHREWPVELKKMGLILLPVWFILMFLTAIVAEARIFLVPQALIFIPGALVNLRSFTESNLPGAARH